MARVLITGASGLIGRRVVEAFGSGGADELIPLGRADVDLLAPEGWRQALDVHRPDVIVHLAWSASSLADYREHEDNWSWVRSTIDGADFAAERGIRFLGTGTSVDSAPAADAYSRSKAAARDELAPRIATGELGWLRPFYVFDEDRPSPAVLRAALDAKAADVPVRLSSPDSRHDFIHARDVASAIRTIVDAGLMGSLDLGSGATSSVAEFVEAFSCSWLPTGAPSSAASTEAIADVAAIRAAGWTPAVTDARLGRTAG